MENSQIQFIKARSSVQKCIFVLAIIILIAISSEYLFAIVQSLFFNTQDLNGFGKTDAIEYWSAYKIWRAGGNPYQDTLMFNLQNTIRPTTEAIMMWNPPWLLTIFRPLLAIQPFLSFAQCWFISSILAYLLASLLLIRTFIPKQIFSLPLWVVIITFPSFTSVLAWGQVSIWLYCGLAFLLIGIKNGLPLLSGTGFCLLTIKPHLFLGLLPLIFICAFQSRTSLKFILKASAVATLILSALILFDSTLIFYWLNAITGATAPTLGASSRSWVTTTIPSALRTLLQFDYNYFTWTAIFTTFLWIPLFSVKKLKGLNSVDKILFILTLALPFSSFAWFYDYIVILCGIIIFWEQISGANKDLLCYLTFQCLSYAYFSRIMLDLMNGLFIVLPLCALVAVCSLNNTKEKY